jgi:predicted SnoaL-like aldol condensation-catalyzing enzyme
MSWFMGRYVGSGPKPIKGVDIFGVAGSKIAEHWDVLQEEITTEQSVNGNDIFNGPQGCVKLA